MDYVALACFVWTCFAYFVAKKIYRKKPLMIFSPVVMKTAKSSAASFPSCR